MKLRRGYFMGRTPSRLAVYRFIERIYASNLYTMGIEAQVWDQVQDAFRSCVLPKSHVVV